MQARQKYVVAETTQDENKTPNQEISSSNKDDDGSISLQQATKAR